MQGFKRGAGLKKEIFSPFANVHSSLQEKIFQINGQKGLGCTLEINISASGRLFRPRSLSRTPFLSVMNYRNTVR